MEAYDTLSLAMAGLRKQGYTEDFNLLQDCLECGNRAAKLFSKDFEVDKFFRFEGESNPDDSSILYAISSPKHSLKGVLVNGYGIYSEDMTDDMVEKLRMPHP